MWKVAQEERRGCSTYSVQEIKLIAQVSYRDVPGIDCAYLAMDTEEGVEVGSTIFSLHIVYIVEI